MTDAAPWGAAGRPNGFKTGAASCGNKAVARRKQGKKDSTLFF